MGSLTVRLWSGVAGQVAATLARPRPGLKGPPYRCRAAGHRDSPWRGHLALTPGAVVRFKGCELAR